MIVDTKNYTVQRSDLVYPELSFVVNGVLFEVFKQLGGEHQEKVYQKAVGAGLKQKGINFTEQYYVPLRFRDTLVGRYYLDFLIDGKIILELKRGRYLPVNIINQTQQYLSALNLPLAIIGCFAHDCVIPKRIINPQIVPKTNI